MFDGLLSAGIRAASLAVILGWLLSAFGHLDLGGYLAAGIPAAAAVLFLTYRGRNRRAGFSLFRRMACWWKYRRILPLVYLLTLALVVAGSVLHEPNNFDGLSYRAPKVLFWLEQHRWHWIHAPYHELNYTLPNYEWLTAPMFLATRGFHSTVVINWIAFALIPPLFFNLLRVWGASRRAAYDWMWLFPSGYGVVMQAGGIGNDLLGLTAILAALYCANRFVASGKGACLLDALLAAGFCSGIKLSNVLLPVFVLILLLREPRRLRSNPLALGGGIALGALASGLIPLVLNRLHSGTFLGVVNSPDKIANPVAGLVGNGLMLIMAAITPPVFPGASQVTALLERALGSGLVSWLQAHYVKFTLKLNELPQEEGGGLGLGITLGVVICFILWMRWRRSDARPAGGRALLSWQWLAYWSCLAVGLITLMAKLGTGPAAPRNLLPWIPLVLGPVLAFLGSERAARARVWRIAAPLIALSVLPALLLTPSRPLLPPSTLLWLAQCAHAGSASVERMQVVYDVYAQRADPFIAIKRLLPPDAQVIGLVSDGSEPTAAWFKPFGQRRPVYLLSADEVKAARSTGEVRYVVVKEFCCELYFKMGPAQWFETFHARPIESFDVTLFASKPAARYTVAKLE